MKRFYKEVTRGPSRSGAEIGVFLDGRPVRTPAKAQLLVTSQALAEAISGEWHAQSSDIDPDSMPLTKVAAAAIDRVIPRRDDAIADIADHGRSDLVCYRADAPTELTQLQETTWQPLVDWVGQTYGARMTVTTGIMPVEQPAAALAHLHAAVATYADFELAALSLAVGTARSLVIGLALSQGRIDAAAAHAACMLDEIFQVDRWGEEEEAEKRSRAARDDLELAQSFLTLLRAC